MNSSSDTDETMLLGTPSEAELEKSCMRIVVLDDDYAFLHRIRAMAQKHGMIVYPCFTPSEFLEVKKSVSFDVAVIDHNLNADDSSQFPHLNGIDIAELFDDTPIILISSNKNLLFESMSWPDSVKAFICKTSGLRTIIDAVPYIARKAA